MPFDFSCASVITSAPHVKRETAIFSFHSSFQKETSGCPVQKSGENREAGVNPARSRHCEEGKSKSEEINLFLTFTFYLAKSGDLPVDVTLQPFERLA
jgi:hypothetical protein